MFSLTVLDHVRLDSEHVARNYTVHARAADRLASTAFAFRIVMAVLNTSDELTVLLNWQAVILEKV